MKKLIVVFFLLVSLFVFFIDRHYKKQTVNTKIPKVIHYVWLGSKELPDEVKKSIETWKKYQPDYEIKQWNETNCDVNANAFVKKYYQKKKYNFASDWCRVLALKEGGIYLDTDMRLNAPIAPLLDAPLVLTLEKENDLSASFMAVEPNHPFVKALKEKYENYSQDYVDISFGALIAPYVWNEVFFKFFKEKRILPQKKKGVYHIYNSNILMHNFNGGENVAEHLYADGFKTLEKSKWFKIFRDRFLMYYAYYFGETKEYFIKKNDYTGYFIKAGTYEKIMDAYFVKIKDFMIILTPWPKIFSCPYQECQRVF